MLALGAWRQGSADLARAWSAYTRRARPSPSCCLRGCTDWGTPQIVLARLRSRGCAGLHALQELPTPAKLRRMPPMIMRQSAQQQPRAPHQWPAQLGALTPAVQTRVPRLFWSDGQETSQEPQNLGSFCRLAHIGPVPVRQSVSDGLRHVATQLPLVHCATCAVAVDTC